MSNQTEENNQTEKAPARPVRKQKKAIRSESSEEEEGPNLRRRNRKARPAPSKALAVPPKATIKEVSDEYMESSQSQS